MALKGLVTKPPQPPPDLIDEGADAAVVAAPSSEDAELVARIRSGDRLAMREMYARYRRRVFAITARIAGVQDAEELSQEVFLKAFRALDGFRGDAQLGTWIYRLAVNAALSHVTRSKGKRSVSDDALADLPAPATIEGDPRARARLEAALERLPPGYRAVIVLHDVEGIEHEEIARTLGCSTGTSKSQLHKARAKMRELLGPLVAAERRGLEK